MIFRIEDACRTACEQIGVLFRSVPADGEFYTADLADDPRGRGDGRIKLFPDGKGGIVQNWKTGDKQAFFIDRLAGATLSPADREHIKAEQERRQREQQAKHDNAARRARALWQAAIPAPPDHPYIRRKRIQPHSARLTTWRRRYQDASGDWKRLAIENALIIPLINENGAYRNLQAIFPAEVPELGRGKDFLPGGALAGLFWWIGPDKTDPVLVAEGYATAATLHQETGHRVYIAFAAGNLLAVGRIIRKHLPRAKIIFAADNDAKTAGNPGLTQANVAAAAVDGLIIVPPTAGDFNDFAARLQGAK